MPIFDYHCTNPECGDKRFDVIEWNTVSDEKRTRRCILCGARMERKTGASSFVINGYNEKNGYSSANV